MTDAAFTCETFDAILSDLIEGTADARVQATAGGHAAGCARCGALHADLVALRDAAARLPALAPSRDLWPDVSRRIEAPAFSIASRRVPVWSLAAAAVLLIAATAGVTWTVARNTGAPTTSMAAQAVADSAGVVPVSAARLAAAYDADIAELRLLLADRPRSLDTATARMLAENLRVIDDAIAKVREALATSPSNVLLSQQLAQAYETKVITLRHMAALPTELTP